MPENIHPRPDTMFDLLLPITHDPYRDVDDSNPRFAEIQLTRRKLNRLDELGVASRNNLASLRPWNESIVAHDGIAQEGALIIEPNERHGGFTSLRVDYSAAQPDQAPVPFFSPASIELQWLEEVWSILSVTPGSHEGVLMGVCPENDKVEFLVWFNPELRSTSISLEMLHNELAECLKAGTRQDDLDRFIKRDEIGEFVPKAYVFERASN